MLIQIYEVQTPKEAEDLIRIGVGHIGSVILDPADWKNPQIRETVKTTQGCGAKSSIIPLYSQLSLILKTLDYYRPDIVHFCETLSGCDGNSDGCRVLFDNQSAIREKLPEIKIMRSIPIAPRGRADRVPTLGLAELFEPCSDFFLTDTFLLNRSAQTHDRDDQPVKGFIGITGQTCDWDMARLLVASAAIPVILAGGISPENAMAGIRHVRPWGIDSCTATNATDSQGKSLRFRKDLRKVKQLVAIARRAALADSTDEPGPMKHA
jgi:phosphoribosylanthranilate isomerase